MRLLLVSLLSFLVACGPKNPCNVVENDFCALEVECGRSNSFPECQKEFAEELTCNEAEALDVQRGKCSARLQEYLAMKPPLCFDRFPQECGEIICSVQGNCEDVTTYETGNESRPE